LSSKRTITIEARALIDPPVASSSARPDPTAAIGLLVDKMPDDVPVLIFHVKPQFYDEIR